MIDRTPVSRHDAKILADALDKEADRLRTARQLEQDASAFAILTAQIEVYETIVGIIRGVCK